MMRPIAPERDKYQKQASAYSGMVGTVDGQLSGAINEMGTAGRTLRVNEKNNELLTENVLACIGEAKTQVSTIQADLSTYSDVVKTKAEELDKEEWERYQSELQQYNRWLAEQRSKETDENSIRYNMTA